MHWPPKPIILKYMRKNSPLQKQNEIQMDAIKQAEINNKIIVAPKESNMPGCRSLDTFVEERGGGGL
jgi:hypothetical protein